MNRTETAMILSILKAAYPKTYTNVSKDEAKSTIMLWLEMFSEDCFEDIKTAVKNHINTEKWPPAISEIRKSLIGIVNPELALTAGQEWEKLHRNLGTYGRDREDEGIQGLSKVTKQVVRSLGWKYLCNSTDQKWDRERFLKMFDELKDVVGAKVAQGETVSGAIGMNEEPNLLLITSNEPVKERPEDRMTPPAEAKKRIAGILKGLRKVGTDDN